MQLKELCDQPPFRPLYGTDVDYDNQGPDHVKSWRARVTVRSSKTVPSSLPGQADSRGGYAYTFTGDWESTKAEAYESAAWKAVTALRNPTASASSVPAPTPATVVRDASALGDATRDFYVTLVGHRLGLNKTALDAARLAASSSVTLPTAANLGQKSMPLVETMEAILGVALGPDIGREIVGHVEKAKSSAG